MTTGFEIVPAVLHRHEIAVVAGALQQEGLERSRAGARHLMRYPIVQPELPRPYPQHAVAPGSEIPQ